MTREELIKSLTLLKEQASSSGGNTFVWDINIDSFNFVIDSAIKALEQEPKTGHWIEEFNDIEGEVRFTCSCCGKYQLFGTDFCYNCGAKMVEPQESEEV